MVTPRFKPTGGFRKPVRLGLWIRDQLADGRETHGYELFSDYAALMSSIPLARKKGKRKIMSYNGFLHYLYLARRLGLIRNVIDDTGRVKEGPALDKGGNPAPHLAPRRFIQAVPGRLGDPAWENLWGAYQEIL